LERLFLAFFGAGAGMGAGAAASGAGAGAAFLARFFDRFLPAFLGAAIPSPSTGFFAAFLPFFAAFLATFFFVDRFFAFFAGAFALDFFAALRAAMFIPLSSGHNFSTASDTCDDRLRKRQRLRLSALTVARDANAKDFAFNNYSSSRRHRDFFWIVLVGRTGVERVAHARNSKSEPWLTASDID
jgi:hypothetical protein